MVRHRIEDRALPVGVFIIMSVLLTVGGVLWLKNISLRPHYTFTVSYEDPDRVNKGVSVYYRGVQVGRVADVELADDMSQTLVKIGVDEDKYRFPIDSKIYVRMEGITGQRFIEIQPSEADRHATRFIAEGQVVKGAKNMTWDKILEQLNSIAEKGLLEKSVVSFNDSMQEFGKAMVGVELASSAIGDSGRTFQGFIAHTNNQLDNTIPEFGDAAVQFKQSVHNMDTSFSRLAGIRDDVGTFLTSADKTRENLDVATTYAAGEVGAAAGQVQATFAGLNGQLTESHLIPNLSNMVSSYSPQPPQEIAMMLTRLDQVNRSNGQLQQSLQAIKIPTHMQLEHLVGTIGDQMQGYRADLPQAHTEIQLQQTLNDIRSFGSQMAPQLEDAELQLRQMRLIAENPTQEQAMNQVIEQLQAMQQQLRGLSTSAAQLEPRVPQLIQQYQAHPALGGGLGATLATIPVAVRRVDCAASQLSHIMSQRFLGFKLLFGKPGAGFQGCEDVKNYPGVENMPCKGPNCPQPGNNNNL